MGCGNVLENAKLNDRSKCSAAPEIVMWVRLKKGIAMLLYDLVHLQTICKVVL